ncbi:MAG: hypothetical protein J5I52_08475 [Saprospiraceae bacterium]|nr:hypothetical protein [Saprospiraceae bacterium]
MQSLFKKLYFWFYLLAIVNLTVGVFFRNEVIFVGSESSEVRIRLVLFQLLFAVALLIMAFFYHKVLIVDYFKNLRLVVFGLMVLVLFMEFYTLFFTSIEIRSFLWIWLLLSIAVFTFTLDVIMNMAVYILRKYR